MTESFAELFEESVAQTQLRTGAIIVGTVLEITNDAVRIVHHFNFDQHDC